MKRYDTTAPIRRGSLDVSGDNVCGRNGGFTFTSTRKLGPGARRTNRQTACARILQ
jgi:hypothetical protein